MLLALYFTVNHCPFVRPPSERRSSLRTNRLSGEFAAEQDQAGN